MGLMSIIKIFLFVLLAVLLVQIYIGILIYVFGIHSPKLNAVLFISVLLFDIFACWKLLKVYGR